MDIVATPFGSIPVVVIGAATGAAIALLGVVISNKGNTNRLLRQHKHESQEKTKDRITNIRREIYLNAAAEMSDALENIGKLPTIDPRNADTMAALKPLSKSLAKIQLICDPVTAPLAAEVGKRIFLANFEAVGKCKPIMDVRIESEGEKEMIEFFQTELSQLYKKHESLLESQNRDQDAIDRTAALIAECQSRLKKHIARSVELSEKMLKLVAQYNEFAATLTRPILEAQVPLAIALRKELELDTDEAEFRTRGEQGFAQLTDALKKSMSLFK